MERILVSVVVVTYNFEKIIVETLESIKRQTYKNIELIITDDMSTDKTVEVCKEWIERNKVRFSNVVLLESVENKGPTSNYNRGVKLAKGEWIKYISDDILDENFILDSICLVNKNPDIKILFSKARIFYGLYQDKNYGGIIPEDKHLKYYNMTYENQLRGMLKECFVVAPTNFIKKSLLEKMGYFDEKYKMYEDYPLWIKILENNERIYFNDSVNVYYRRWKNSVSYNGEKYRNESQVKFHREYYDNDQKYKYNNIIERYEKNLDIYKDELIIKLGNKKVPLVAKLLKYLKLSYWWKIKYRILFLIFLGVVAYFMISG